jgi:hypothetical protein
MADLAISALTVYAAYHSDDELEVLDVHDTTFASSGTNKRVTLADLVSLVGLVTAGGSYADPAWITSLAGSKVSGDIAGNAGGLSAAIAESQVTGLTTDLAAKATDSAVVHLAGTETVTGAKIFSSTITGNITGTAGGLSAAIAESQVTGLTTDLAAKAADSAVVHNSGGTITGIVDAVELTVRANAVQTANLQEWYNSSGVLCASVNSYGSLTTTPAGNGIGLRVNRTNGGTANGEIWSIQVQNATPASSDQMAIGCSSQNYTTGGAFAWVGNAQFYVYLPLGASLKIGAGTLSTGGIATFSGTGVAIAGPAGIGGAAIPASGLGVTGAIVASGAITAAGTANISGAAGTYRQLVYNSGASPRWAFAVNGLAESGSDAGSDLQINTFHDNGTGLGTPFSIKRSTGAVTITGALTVTAAATLPVVVHATTADAPSAGTWTADLSVTDWHSATLAANTTVAVSNATVGQIFYLRATQAATGGPYTIAFTGTGLTTITWLTPTYVAPTMPTTANAVLLVCLRCTGAGTFDGFLVGQSAV